MTLPILYKYTKTGAVQQWEITVVGDRFWTNEGQQGGVITQSLATFCKGKNIGKKNETTPEQQAQAEAQAKWQKKVDSGYDQVLTKGSKFFEPMLAEKYEDRKDLVFTVRIFVQPKLDGLRAISQNNSLMSRNGKPYLASPHLYQDEVILDGELYNHEYKEDFNKIVSLCKKQKPTPEELTESLHKVQHWIYDFPEYKDVFSKRYEALKEWHQKSGQFCHKLVPTHEVFSFADIDSWHERFLEQGFEGSIIRLDLGPYENKRSKQLLKYKNWMDEEFKILGYNEGEGGRAGTIGNFVISLPNGNTCKSNVKGDFEFLKQVWKDRDQYIGTEATIKFFGYTPDGALRFPYIIKLNRSEYE